MPNIPEIVPAAPSYLFGEEANAMLQRLNLEHHALLADHTALLKRFIEVKEANERLTAELQILQLNYQALGGLYQEESRRAAAAEAGLLDLIEIFPGAERINHAPRS